MTDHVYLRTAFDGAAVALSRNRFRKQILRVGEWSHKAAPGGVLQVTADFLRRVVANFNAGVRDDVPVPLGHDRDALTSIGQVVALELSDDGRELWGVHEIPAEEDATKLGTVWTGSSALLDLNGVDKETGKELGPVLVHNAITNAPHINDLAPFEAIALGEDAQDAVVISLQDVTDERGGAMNLEEFLAGIQEISDDDLRAALTDSRPELFSTEKPAEGDEEEAEAAIEAAKAEGREALVAALAEKGISVSLSEDSGAEGEAEVDIESAPEFVALSERVEKLEGEKAEDAAEAVIDAAIKAGQVLPAQKDALVKVALSEDGMATLEGLIPEAKLIDLTEKGVAPADDTTVELSEEDAEEEAARLVAAYATSGKKEA